jgi:hypothetical protein
LTRNKCLTAKTKFERGKPKVNGIAYAVPEIAEVLERGGEKSY